LRNREGNEVREDLQIDNLLQKLSSEEAEEILGQLDPEIEFFSNRRPVQRTDKRTCLKFDRGKESEGRRAREKLMSPSPVDRLVALEKFSILFDAISFTGRNPRWAMMSMSSKLR
jgi:hypothetical protein